MSWGTVQEPASLNQLLDIFPQSVLVEVGLHFVDKDALPASWSIKADDLPPIGASPDAIIIHTCEVKRSDLQQLKQAWSSKTPSKGPIKRGPSQELLKKVLDTVAINTFSNNTNNDGTTKAHVPSTNTPELLFAALLGLRLQNTQPTNTANGNNSNGNNSNGNNANGSRASAPAASSSNPPSTSTTSSQVSMSAAQVTQAAQLKPSKSLVSRPQPAVGQAAMSLSAGAQGRSMSTLAMQDTGPPSQSVSSAVAASSGGAGWSKKAQQQLARLGIAVDEAQESSSVAGQTNSASGQKSSATSETSSAAGQTSSITGQTSSTTGQTSSAPGQTEDASSQTVQRNGTKTAWETTSASASLDMNDSYAVPTANPINKQNVVQDTSPSSSSTSGGLNNEDAAMLVLLWAHELLGGDVAGGVPSTADTDSGDSSAALSSASLLALCMMQPVALLVQAAGGPNSRPGESTDSGTEQSTAVGESGESTNGVQTQSGRGRRGRSRRKGLAAQHQAEEGEGQQADGENVDRSSSVNVAIREIVEVKNTCPFDVELKRRGPKGGKVVWQYVVRDKGPRENVFPLWIPQLQMHMLAQGCGSALLVSRSCTKGITVFRVFRDDTYLMSMLLFVSKFYVEYVKKNVRPPKDMFYKDASYRKFLNQTTSIARNAQVVVYQNKVPHMEGTSDQPFV